MTENHLTPDERAEIIRVASDLDARTMADETAPANRHSPGRFEGNEDRALAVALDILAGAGASDEDAGAVDRGYHGSRVGRCVLWTDDRGFKTVTVYASDDRAAGALDEESRRQNRPDPDAEIPIRAGDVSQAIDALQLALNEGFGWRNAARGARDLLADTLDEAGADVDA